MGGIDMNDMQQIAKRGRKPFVEEHFNQFLSTNKKTLRGINDASEAFDIYSTWASSHADKTISEASFSKLFKINCTPSVVVQKSVKEENLHVAKHHGFSLVEQFDLLESYVTLASRGVINSLFVSGIAGIGKTETVNRKLVSLGVPYVSYSGGVKDTYSLAKILYENRENKVIVFDDFDSVFRNKNFVDILKIALVDHKDRTITWADSTKRAKKDAVPTRFHFSSTIIFISNNMKFDKNLKNRSKIIRFTAEKIECLEWVHDHFTTFLSEMPMSYKEMVYNFIKANIGRFKTMDYRTFKNAMVDFLVCVEVKKMDINDKYWQKMVISNAEAF